MNSNSVGFAVVLFSLVASAVPLGSGAKAAGVLTVKNDRGGVVIDYALRVLHFKEQGTDIRVSGACMSACTLFLALPKEQICITQGARFGFHLPYGSSPSDNRIARDYLYKSYPLWVKAWLEQRGGLSRGMKVMDYSYAKRHMKLCPGSASKNLAFDGGSGSGSRSLY